MTAIVVGQVAGTIVGATSDGKVWALGRSYTPDEVDELIVYMTKAAKVARLEGAEHPVEPGQF